MSELILLAVAAVGTSIISAVLGMAGGIVLLSIMTIFLPIHTLVPIHGIVQLVSNSSRCLSLRKHVDTKILFPFLTGLPFGVLCSYFLLKTSPDPRIFLVAISVAIIFAVLRGKSRPLTIPHKGFVLVGFASGFLSLLIGATGPFLAMFFLRKDLTKEQVIATKASTQLFTHLLKIPAFLALSFNYGAWAPEIVIMCVGVIIGTQLGVASLKKLNNKWFWILFRTALLFAACRLLYKAWAMSQF